jgi:hypothetical protein
MGASIQYYKRHWEESRGDNYDHWGPATYFFEADEQGVVLRQVEVYEAGQILRYDGRHWRDDFGMLADQQLDLDEFRAFETSKEEFDRVWPPGSDPGPVGT